MNEKDTANEPVNSACEGTAFDAEASAEAVDEYSSSDEPGVDARAISGRRDGEDRTGTARRGAPAGPDDAVRSVVTGGTESSASSSNSPGKSAAMPRLRLFAAAVGACMCVALIGVSAWSLMTGGASMPDANQAQRVAGRDGSSMDQAGSDDDAATLSTDAEDDAAQDKTSGADKSGSVGQADASNESSSGSAPSDSTGHGTSGGGAHSAGGSSSNGASGGASNGNSNGTSHGGTGGGSSSNAGSGSSSGSTGGSSANGGGSAGGAPESGQDEPKTVTVTISADGSLGGGGVAGPITLTFEEGATVYDALASAGWSAQASWGAFGAYVTSINGVAADAQTGWTYTVNGSMPSTACSSYKLADGDVVVWTFVKVK